MRNASCCRSGGDVSAPVCVTVDHLRGPGDDRLLALLDRHGLRTTFFVEGKHGASHPERVADLVARGHEVGLHGWAHEAWAHLDPATAQELLVRGADALTAAAGHPPRGFRAPGGERGAGTAALLVEHGIDYDASLGDGRTPQVLPEGIVSLPFVWGHVDGAHYLRPEPATAAWVESRWLGTLDRAAAGGLPLVFVVHAHVSCLDDDRLAVLDRLLGRVATDDRLEPMQMSELARRVRLAAPPLDELP
jgi:peptidoglycan/xylan/chitin deacetylase (PgdA/CDA1 family)